jgi:hypothetical protein
MTWLASIRPTGSDRHPVACRVRAPSDGWYLRSDIIWSKPNPMPESVTDRPTKAHEYLFLLAKSERYYYDAAAIRGAVRGVDARNLRSHTTGRHEGLRRSWRAEPVDIKRASRTSSAATAAATRVLTTAGTRCRR